MVSGLSGKATPRPAPSGMPHLLPLEAPQQVRPLQHFFLPPLAVAGSHFSFEQVVSEAAVTLFPVSVTHVVGTHCATVAMPTRMAATRRREQDIVCPKQNRHNDETCETLQLKLECGPSNLRSVFLTPAQTPGSITEIHWHVGKFLAFLSFLLSSLLFMKDSIEGISSYCIPLIISVLGKEQ